MNRSTRLALAALAVISLATLPAAAAMRQVCSSGCAYATIQGAVDDAAPGDTIMVLDAQHTEGGVVIGKDLAVIGDPLDPPVVQAASAPGVAVDRVLEILPNADVVLQDLVIRHGRPAVDGGGAILNAGDLRLVRVLVTANDANGGTGGGIRSTGPLALEDSLIAGNAADLLGGGISCEALCTLYMLRSTLDGNLVRTTSTGSTGGGGLSTEGSGLLEGCFVTDNVSVGGTHGRGGGIRSGSGALVLVDTHVTGNEAGGGGGISSNAPLVIVRGSVASNSATNPNWQGGGLAVAGDPTILESTSVSGNTAHAAAGLWTVASNTVIRRTTINDNVAQSSSGGGGVTVEIGSAVLEQSLVANNAAGVGGGVVVGSFADARIQSSTISGNTAAVEGGGVWVIGTLSLSSSTVTDNTADPDGLTGVDGGGLFVPVGGGGDVDIRNSIIAGNHDPGPQVFFTAPDCAGPVTIDGWVSLGTTGLSGLGNPACLVTGAPPDLGGNQGMLPLADNGGPTMTHALEIGSPNIDTGDPTGCKDGAGNPLGHDQRGGARIATCDRGAYEAGAALPFFADGFESAGTWLWDGTTDEPKDS